MLVKQNSLDEWVNLKSYFHFKMLNVKYLNSMLEVVAFK